MPAAVTAWRRSVRPNILTVKDFLSIKNNNRFAPLTLALYENVWL